ncbi:MAG: hypothetical protein N2327_07865 [Caldimicrobium sp.]|nr:hypothetical protein [Caldimicrobium sp.]
MHKFRTFLEGKKGVKIENQYQRKKGKLSKKIRGKFGVLMFSLSLTPSPIKGLKIRIRNATKT